MWSSGEENRSQPLYPARDQTAYFIGTFVYGNTVVFISNFISNTVVKMVKYLGRSLQWAGWPISSVVPLGYSGGHFLQNPHFGRALVLLCIIELFLNSNHPAFCMPFFRSFTFFYVCTISLFVRLSQHVCKPRKNALRKPLYSIYYVLHTVCHILMLYTIYYIPYAIHYLPYNIYTIYFIQCTAY